VYRFRLSHLTLAVTLACVALVVAMAWWRIHRDSSVAALLSRLPEQDAVIFYVDVEALRASGLLTLLAGSGQDQESEYRDFVRESGFDYVTDLDGALVSVNESDRFFLLRGRFDWSRLARYVDSRGGTCHNGFCRVRGSVPGRYISFFAVAPSIMGLASSPDSWAANALERKYRDVDAAEIPAAPFWLIAPGRLLSRASWLPEPARTLSAVLAQARRIVITAAAAEAGFEAQLMVECPGVQQAAGLADRLTTATNLLARLVSRDSGPTAASNLGSILARGTFRTDGTQVVGRWFIPSAFLETLAGPGP